MSNVTQNCFSYNKHVSCPTCPLWMVPVCESFSLKLMKMTISHLERHLIKLIVFIWNSRLGFFLGGSNSHIGPVTNAQTSSVTLNICLPLLPFRTLMLHQWKRGALKLWTADAENRAAETLRRSVQVAVLNQCARIMSRCITVRNHISIRIIKKNVESRCAAKCTLSSVSLPLYEKPLCLCLCCSFLPLIDG